LQANLTDIGVSMRIDKMIFILACTVLCACSSGPVKRYYPPLASIQQLQQLPNGEWQMQLRVQNFSTTTVEFNKLQLQVQFQATVWMPASDAKTISIGANSAEIIPITLHTSNDTNALLQERLKLTQTVQYAIKGTIQSIDPNRNYSLDYQGRLSPAPGLNGVFR
jgi:hypothetical protein